jgi:hypothetical protein
VKNKAEDEAARKARRSRDKLLRSIIRERDKIAAKYDKLISTASMQVLDRMILRQKSFEKRNPRPDSPFLDLVLTSIEAKISMKYWEAARKNAATGERTRQGLAKGNQSRWGYDDWMPAYVQIFMDRQRERSPVASNNAMIAAAKSFCEISESTIRRYLRKGTLTIPPRVTD